MSDSVLPIAFNPAGILLDPKKGLSRQLYHALRARVLDGRLSGGARLPASRDLAAALGISRNSVVRAYAAKKVVHQLVHRVFNRLTHRFIHKNACFTCDYIQ